MGNFASGEFKLKNPHKYIGKQPIIYRSSWELAAMRLFDAHPNIMQWASESVSIPYHNPLTHRWSFYVPDFLVVFVDRTGKKHGEIMEIKPMKETLREHAKSRRDKLVQAVNLAKWAAAQGWCHKQQLKFRVLTEHELMGVGKRK